MTAASGYDVRVNGGATIDAGASLSYVFGGLTPSTAYTVEVRARNAYGVSAWVPATFTTAAPPPTFDVRLDGGPVIDVGTALFHTFAGLAPLSSHVAEVRTRRDSDGLMSAWVARAFTTPAPPPPDGVGVWLFPVGADPTDLDERVDFSCYVDELAIAHGRSDTGSQPEPSSVTVDFTTDAPGDSALWALVDIGALVRVVVVLGGVVYDRFAGRVTDLALAWDEAGADTPEAGVGQFVAVSVLADYARRIVGAEPFPQELDGARVARTFALAGLDLDPATSDPGTVQILARDVDAKPALGVAHEAATSASGVVWQTRGGDVRYADAEHRRGAAVELDLDACDILVSPTWGRNIDGLVNDISIGYGVAPEGGGEAPTYTASNLDSIRRHGEYGYSVSTDLADAAAAAEMGGRILARNAEPVWTLNALPVDLMGLSAAEHAAVLGLEVHSLIRVTGLPAIGSAPTSIAAWVEGWRERLAYGVHEVELTISDYCRSVPPPRWNDVGSAVTWDTYGAGTWDDAACTGGPDVGLGRWDDVSASTRWDQTNPATTWDTYA